MENTPRLVTSSTKHYAFLVFFCTLAIGAIVGGTIAVGTPFKLQATKRDDARVTALKRIQQEIEGYATGHFALPNQLSDLPSMLVYPDRYSDPQTRIPYEYRITSVNSYDLCATFETQVKQEAGHDSIFTSHKKGQDCFQLTLADPRSLGGDSSVPIITSPRTSTPTPIPTAAPLSSGELLQKDQQTKFDIEQVQKGINGYYQENHRMPHDLNDLNKGKYGIQSDVNLGYGSSFDPATGKDNLTYQLCGSFLVGGSVSITPSGGKPTPVKVGQNCFNFVIN